MKKTASLLTGRQQGIYLLPNLLTTATLFAGFYAVVAAMRGYFETAAISIFLAMLADGLDGRVARLTNTQTAFGAEYDSLADVIAFGISPALLLYSWSLVSLGKAGWLVSFIYTAATSLRLARFNIQIQENDKRNFQGLPCPASACAIAGIVWVAVIYDVSRIEAAAPVALLACLLAGFMVSRIRYYSFKQIDFRGKVPFFAVVSLVVALSATAMKPAEVLAGLFFMYVFSGPTITLFQMRRVRKKRGR